MRLVQIKDETHCFFVEYLPAQLLDTSKQIWISDEDRIAIGLTKCFDLKTLEIIDYDNTEDLESKYAEGLISKTEYDETKALSQSYREKINKLEEE